MAQRKQLTWTDLRVGLFVLAGLFILAIGIFYVTGAGILGPKYRVTTFLPEVDGLAQGAPVALDGIQIGNVESIRLTPDPADDMHNITLVLRLEKKYQNDVREDSSASLITQGLLGNRYVTISRGRKGNPVPNKGVVPGREEAATKQLVERGAELMENLNVLSKELRGITDQISRGSGTIGKLLNDPSLYNHLDQTAIKFQSMASSISDGQGTLGKLISNDDLYQKADATLGQINDVVGAVKDQKGTAGKLIYDPSVYDNAKGFLEKSNSIFDGVQQGKGSLGKLVKDDALYNNLRDASANVRDVSAKLNSNEGSMGKFVNDPAFYDNVTGLTGDLRLLIADFRQNPKKFLHVKFSAF
jgi:phospholipid/cholesterol/gamma-HCH transport system substrate-binding protein